MGCMPRYASSPATSSQAAVVDRGDKAVAGAQICREAGTAQQQRRRRRRCCSPSTPKANTSAAGDRCPSLSSSGAAWVGVPRLPVSTCVAQPSSILQPEKEGSQNNEPLNLSSGGFVPAAANNSQPTPTHLLSPKSASLQMKPRLLLRAPFSSTLAGLRSAGVRAGGQEEAALKTLMAPSLVSHHLDAQTSHLAAYPTAVHDAQRVQILHAAGDVQQAQVDRHLQGQAAVDIR